MIKTLLSISVFACAAIAQPISVGIKGGLPLTDAFDVGSSADTRYEATTKRYIVGPMIELRLPAGFAIEFDALYSALKYQGFFGTAGSVLGATTNADAWDFPLVLKYKFGGANAVAASVRPYVEAGAAFRRLTDIKYIGSFVRSDLPPELRDRDLIGFVAGGGVEIRALFIRISPELRWVRWNTNSFLSGVSNLLEANRNQAQFLVGIHF